MGLLFFIVFLCPGRPNISLSPCHSIGQLDAFDKTVAIAVEATMAQAAQQVACAKLQGGGAPPIRFAALSKLAGSTTKCRDVYTVHYDTGVVIGYLEFDRDAPPQSFASRSDARREAE